MPSPYHATYRYVPGYTLGVAVLKRRRHMCMPESPGDLAYCLVTVKTGAAVNVA